MSMFRAITSALGCAGHWIGETYCALGQRIAERIEQVSDTIAEERHLAERQVERVGKSHGSAQQVIQIQEFRVVNGHRHLD
jgi:hypothetical protein